ncbi:DUF4349 domain-containing protein [Streptomyces sp. VRA16 Mangrove soil]|uniref:DUF4349 domain-containing protein n=1 Tax=Streptomyces sp. VRA16 Mangrove soil TaxID=2817434 RepID=UPI001A9DB1B7|nr:DUF4349 domain-containing protein [Streptomyces sp. VRA16 Mangrove soil]MBO1335564.1 DUF4349 domain-containing protein [Streptomyces sp. VRA16 Mangrove soil]
MHVSGSRTAARLRPLHALALLLLAAALALTGCSGANSSSDSGDGDKAAAGGKAASREKGAADGASDSGKSSARKPPRLTGVHIIRTASLSVRVKDVPDALDRARTATEDAGGYVGNETTDRDGDGRERTRVTLRVPQESYEEVIGQLAGTGRLLSRNVTAKDVTDQVVDVDSRVASQRASVARVRELMDRATKLSDVVTLEGELSSRESELEALLAQQASLKDRTTMATITLSLSQAPVKAADGDDGTGFTDALSGGWNAFVTFLKWIGIVLAAVLPFAALVALSALVWLRVVRPRLSRRPAPRPVHTALGPLPAHPRSEPDEPKEQDEHDEQD